MKFEFLSRHPSLHDIFLQQVERDADGARLSKSMRAYYKLRPYIPLRLRWLLQKSKNASPPPDWCFPRQFMQQLIAGVAVARDAAPIIHPWPDNAEYAFVLTHDVETDYGVSLIEKMAGIEEDLGLRSSWNIVPFKYKVDPGFRRELVARGFEIGVHGYNHDGTLYSSRKVFDRRAKAINGMLRDYPSVGFRSPMVHRNLEWLQDLDVDYDASCFDADAVQPMPGGVGTIWPFIAGKFVELPYTMPQDHSLFISLGHTDSALWQQKFDFVAANHGMVMLLTHPDYLDTPRLLDIYRDFLISVKERGDDYWHALPREVSAWWRARAASTIERSPDGKYAIHGPAREQGRVVTLGTDGTRLTMESIGETTPMQSMPRAIASETV